MPHTFHIDPQQTLELSHLNHALQPGSRIQLSPVAVAAINKGRAWLDSLNTEGAAPVYGINTGFGALYNITIPEDQLGQLQQNLVMSHACGTGDEVSDEIVRLMLLLKVQALARGNSGVQLITVQRLADFFSHDILPVVYEQGSLGASGDLAPLAHLCLPLLGLGEVRVNGVKRAAADVLNEKGWQPVALQSKEGLALLNGTQFMNAYGVWCLLKAQQIADAADVIGALSLEGFDGRPEPFFSQLHTIRPHAGQMHTASRIRRILEGSELITRAKTHVQDPYAFRCMPQVHGASRDAISYCEKVFGIEANSVTDNPTIFPDENLVLSGGNFHGQPLAIALDFLAIALSEFGSISERRTYQLIHGLRGLPMFLIAKPGLDSGMMIPQYTAASIASQNKQLCTPASVDSIPSSAGQEDHVSMGANAATKCRRIVLNVQRILAIELMNAAQAMEFRRPAKTSPLLEKLHSDYRATVPALENDRVLSVDIEKSIQFFAAYNFEV
ncbi:MAG: histidine ammonia-lyase [Bacteroidota bacterium]|jgi:histidine ammonia-lyase